MKEDRSSEDAIKRPIISQLDRITSDDDKNLGGVVISKSFEKTLRQGKIRNSKNKKHAREAKCLEVNEVKTQQDSGSNSCDPLPPPDIKQEPADLAKSARFNINQDPLACVECDMKFTAPSRLRDHNLAVHKRDFGFPCMFCNKKYHVRNRLHLHMKLAHHAPAFVCRYCGKGLTSARLVEDHERKHRGERPYVCDFCQKSFYAKDYLSAHVKNMHLLKETAECDVCHKQFRNKNQLNDHRKLHFEEMRVHRCVVCTKSYHHKQKLKLHMISHTNEKAYRCEQCGAAFAHKEKYNFHLIKHTGHRNHVCEVCGKAFFLKKILTRHLLTHNNVPCYKCNACGRKYKLEERLVEHKRKYHTEFVDINKFDSAALS